MSPKHCIALVPFVWSVLVAQAAPPKPDAESAQPAPAIRWETDFDAALQRASAEKRPLFVAFLMDDEPANDETVKQHYTDPRIQKVLGNFVCLVGCIGEHAGTEPGCAKFPGLECRHHQEVEKKARARWLIGDLVCTPQHVFCDPQGNVLHRKIYLVPKVTLLRCLLRTLEDCAIDTSSLKIDVGKGEADVLPDTERANVDAWLRDLGSNNLEVRQAALRGLGAADDPRAMAAVLKCCEDKNDDATRLAAIGALGRKGNYRAVDALAAMLKDGKAPILGEVAKALDTIQIPDAVPPLLKAIKKEKRDRVLGALLRAAAHSQPSNAEVHGICLKQLKGASAQLRASVLVALGRLDPNEKTLAAVTPLLESRNQDTRGLATWVVGNQCSPAAHQALVQLQNEEKTPEVQKLLVLAIRRARGEAVEGYDTQYSTFFSAYLF